MKKILSLILIIVMMFNLVISVNAEEKTLEISAPSAILVEKTTGRVLYEKDADKQLRPASVTKIMTMLLIMEAINDGQFGYDDIVTVSAYATSMGGSQVYLKEGEKMTVDEMLKCIAVASANDGCVAMAEFVSGSVSEFVARMNEKARQLGMNNTNFVNCTGLEAEGHLTTARDISIMSQELLKYNDIKKYTTIWMDSIRNGEFGLSNTNKLIRFYDGATGLKTGYTSESKYCISATAQKNGMELIAVIMAAETSDKRTEDAKTLLNYGFSKYTLYSAENLDFESVKVLKGKQDSVLPIMKEPLKSVVEKGSEKNIKYEVDICEDVCAPVEKGQKIGEIILKIDGTELVKTDIIASFEVKKADFKDIFFDLLRYFLII